MSVVVCNQSHSTRLMYQQASGGAYLNPCVAVCVDGSESPDVSGATLPTICSSSGGEEFYLNSDVPEVGTSKPTKYSLILDENGFKSAELQLLTYWSTYLCGRCTSTVSIATPAYYALLAARRGKVLLAAGATPDKLKDVSESWLGPGKKSMYFI